MKKKQNDQKSGKDSTENKTGKATDKKPTGNYGVGENQGDQAENDPDRSDTEGRKGRGTTNYHDDGDTYENTKPGRGYQDMNNRSLSQDYHKKLDEDEMEHYDSTSGFEEFDEYADEENSGEDEGNDQEYNSRYNDDREETNEREELNVDTDTSMGLEEQEESKTGGKGKRKRLPPNSIARKYKPMAQTESESDNQEVPAQRNRNPQNNKTGSKQTDRGPAKKAAKGKNRPGQKRPGK